MSKELTPYPTYKSSDMPWLGKTPAHWEIERLKHNASNVIDPAAGQQPDELYVALEHIESWTGRIRDSGPDASFESQVKRFREGDVLFGKLRPYLAKVARPMQPGVCVGEFFVLRPRGAGLHADYLEQLLRSKPVIDVINSSTFGAKMPRADWEFVGNLALPLPPACEQAAIVRFLDHADRRINRYIRAKRRLIELLNEQKQAIIHQAVTRGLDPNVSLKPSGVEWLGDIPEHWSVRRLKDVAQIQTGLTLGKVYASDQLETRPYLRVANVQDGYLDLRNITTVSVPATEASSCELRPGDVLMTEGGDIDKLGRGYIWRGEIADCLHQNHIFAVRPDRRYIIPEFLAMLTSSRRGRIYFQLTAKQTTNLASTNSTTLKRFPLALPSIEDQHRILDAVALETAAMDAAIARSLEEINLIREYRTRLIADVVTGKLDVRGVDLPELDEDEALADLDLDGLADGEVLPDDEELDDAVE